MLATHSGLLVSLALLLLERASATAVDQGPFPGEPASVIVPLLDALCALFFQHGRPAGDDIGLATASTDAGDTKEAKPESVGTKKGSIRPFDWFLRREEAVTTDLLQPIRQSSPQALLTPIMNILRNLALIPSDIKAGGGAAYGQLMAQHRYLLPHLLIPILTNRRWWPCLNLEIYTSAWLVLGQLLPHQSVTMGSPMAACLTSSIRLSLLQVAVEDVRFCWEAQHRWAHIVHPSSEQLHEPGQLIEFIARLPSRTFSLTSIALGLLNEEGEADEAETETETGAEVEAGRNLRQVSDQLLEALERATLLLFPLAFAYTQNAQQQVSMAQAHPATYASVLGRHLHNPQAALPDGGHLELVLSGILVLVRRGDRPLDGALLRTLISWIDTVRSLYVRFACPRPGTVPYVLPREGTWQSILVVGGPSSLAAHYSHPYRLLLLAQDILLSMPPPRSGELGETEVRAIIEWVAGPAPGPVHADLLRPAVMERLVNSLLL